MKLQILAGAAAFAVLSACGGAGGGGKAAFVNECVKGGEEKTTCTCIADKLEAELDAKTFAKLTKAIAAGEEKGSKMMEAMPADEQAKIAGAMMSAGFGCAMGS